MEASFRLLPLLAPAVRRLPQLPTRASRVVQHLQQPCRTSSVLPSRAFTTVPARRADDPSTSRFDMDIADLLDDTLSGNKSPVANRTSRTPSSGTAKSSDAILANRPREGNSFDVFTSGMSSAYPSPLASQGSQMDRMIPSSPLGLAPSMDIVEPPMKLNSSTGRQVRVDPERRMDVGRAFRSLEILCARNSVKRDFMRQRFHERPGLKRKRLKSERWRKNFKAGFKETVRMVMKMKKQGW